MKEQNPFTLTLEQEFQIKMMENLAKEMSRDQMLELLLQVSEQLMVKDNVIRDLMKKEVLMAW